MATGHGQQVMAGGVRQYGLDVHAQWALVVEGDGGAVMLGEFDFALAVQRQVPLARLRRWATPGVRRRWR